MEQYEYYENSSYATETVRQILVFCKIVFSAPPMLTSYVSSSFCGGRGGRWRSACSAICKICLNTDQKDKTTWVQCIFCHQLTVRMLQIHPFIWDAFPVYSSDLFCQQCTPLCRLPRDNQQEDWRLKMTNRLIFVWKDIPSSPSLSGSPLFFNLR